MNSWDTDHTRFDRTHQNCHHIRTASIDSRKRRTITDSIIRREEHFINWDAHLSYEKLAIDYDLVSEIHLGLIVHFIVLSSMPDSTGEWVNGSNVVGTVADSANHGLLLNHLSGRFSPWPTFPSFRPSLSEFSQLSSLVVVLTTIQSS